MAANPVQPDDSLASNEIFAVHDLYLKRAIVARDFQKEFFGNLYLFSDHLKNANFVEATRYLLKAESIANHSGNISWQGAVYLRKGIISHEMGNFKGAILNYKKALPLCIKMTDSLGIGDIMQEIGTTYSRLNNYDSAHYFYQAALPYVKKFYNRQQLGSFYNNYGNLLKDEKKYTDAQKYMDSAISIVMEGNDKYRQSIYRNNMAAILVEMGKYEEALPVIRKCISINKENNWPNLLLPNYYNLVFIYEYKKDYHAALDNFKIYNLINDSLKGAGMQEEIAMLNAKSKIQEKELAFQKSQLELTSAKNQIQKRTTFIIIALLLVAIVIWRWVAQIRNSKKVLLQSRNELTRMTRILIEKNSLLSALEEKVSTPAFTIITAANALPEETTSPAEKTEEIPAIEKNEVVVNEKDENHEGINEFETNIYNQRILTPADWSAFKIYFEKAYPGYLLRLRNAYPSLTEAEERLFLFIKLKLTNKEAAAILGISSDSVKKTRTRLRKRLGLEEGADLDGFVNNF